MRVCDYLLILDGFDGENSSDQLDGECLHVCVKRIGKSVSLCFRGWVYQCMSDSKEPQLSKNLSQKSLTNRRERAGEKEGGIEERRSNKREKQERRP